LKHEIAYFDFIQHSGVLEELDAALVAPRFVRTEFPGADECLMYAERSDLRLCRQASSARAAALRLTAESADWPEFVRAWTHLVRLAMAYSHDAVVISHLVSQSALVRAMDELCLLLTEHRLDASVCGPLLDSLATGEVLAPFDSSLEGERLVMYDLIQRCYSDDSRGDGLLMIDALEKFAENDHWSRRFGSIEHPVFQLVGVVYPRRAETKHALDEFMDAAVRQSHMTRLDSVGDSVSLERLRDELRERHVFLRFCLPVLEGALDRHHAFRAKIAATRILLGIELYEALHGEPPQSLDDLVPEWLPQAPIDAVSGRSFVYVRREPTPDDPRRFLLYSVGVDGEDNGGVETDEARPDAALSSRVKPELRDGFDYIFNRLREPAEEQ